MPKAADRTTRVAPTRDVMKFMNLESQIHDLADMANLVMNAAEKWIEGGVLENKQDVHMPEGERNMLMFGVRQLNLLSRDLREQFYVACGDKPEANHAES